MDFFSLMRLLLVIALIWVLWPVIFGLVGIFFIIVFVFFLLARLGLIKKRSGWGYSRQYYFGEKNSAQDPGHGAAGFREDAESTGYEWVEEQGDIVDLPPSALRSSNRDAEKPESLD